MLLVDAHQNIAHFAQQFGRDYRAWAWQARARESVPELPPATTSLRDNMLGRVGIVFAQLQVIAESAPQARSWQTTRFRNSAEAIRQALWQLDSYRRLADESGLVRLVLSRGDLEAVEESWGDTSELQEHVQGIVVCMKGAAAIQDPSECEEWWGQGLRGIAPAWLPSAFSESMPGNLTRAGYTLLEAMAACNMLLDISGFAQRSAAAVLERYPGAIIASCGSPRRFTANSLGLSDDTIRRLAARNGVLGIAVHARLLRRDWDPSDRARGAQLAHWVDALDYVCQLTGSVDHVGLGSNIDGISAMNQLPVELDTSSDLWRLTWHLGERGFSLAQQAAILGGNMLGKLREALPGG